MFINEALIKQAEAAAKTLLESGDARVSVQGGAGDAGSPTFLITRSKEGVTVLRILEVEGEQFYFGMDTSSA